MSLLEHAFEGQWETIEFNDPNERSIAPLGMDRDVGLDDLAGVAEGDVLALLIIVQRTDFSDEFPFKSFVQLVVVLIDLADELLFRGPEHAVRLGVDVDAHDA